MTISLDSHPIKDINDWTPSDVRAFLESILPGHSCVDNFTYTSGYVLGNLEKEDVRRQTKDEEAANIIWAELKGSRGRTAAGGVQRGLRASPLGVTVPSFWATGASDRSLSSGSELFTVYVRTNQEVALEFNVLARDSVASLKQAISERQGTMPDAQRLVANGVSMQDDRTLGSYGLRHGAHLLLVPQLRDQSKSVPRTFAPRGILMVPGSCAWRPRGAEQRPLLPVLCSDVSRGFPVAMLFSSTGDVETFAIAAQQGQPPVLEIQPAKPHQAPLETQLGFDAETGTARLENSGDILQPSTEYVAFIHYGGRGGHTRVTLQTGANVL